MKSATRILRAAALAALSVVWLIPHPALAQAPESKFADVEGIRLHYLVAGTGDPVVLLHGYAETSHMWLPLIAKLSDRHTVIAPDLRGFGNRPRLPKATPRRRWRAISTRWSRASNTTVSAWSATISG